MLITLFLFLLILGILVFVHELGHFWVARKNGIKVHEFAFGFKPRLISWKRGDTEYAINLLPFGGYVRLEGETENTGKHSFTAAPPLTKVKVLVAGVTMNILFAWLALTLAYWLGSTPLTNTFANHRFVETRGTITISSITPDSPAAAAGWQVGDLVTTSSSQTITSAGQFIKLAKTNAGTLMPVTLLRADQTIETNITPRVNPPAGQGALGITLAEDITASAPFFAAPLVALSELWHYVALTFSGLGQIGRDLLFHQKVSEEVSGLVGVGVATGVVRRIGVGAVLQFMSLISVNLALINMVPIPPLDGGHVLFVALEAWRKKTLDTVRHYVTLAGFGALVLFALIVTYKDIVRFDILNRLF